MGYGRVCAGVLVRLLMKMDGLSHYGCPFFFVRWMVGSELH
jgi:hypothetical protein